jgi:hypothetical protein
MSKRTRIAVVVAALLLGVVGPVVAADGDRQAAQAGAVDARKVFRLLDEIIPRTGWTRTGRPAFLAPQQRWKLANLACTVNQAHDNVYEYEPVVDELLLQLDLPSPYRYQSPVLALSQRIHQYKEDLGAVYEIGSEGFCEFAEWRADQHAVGTTG